MGYSVSWIVVKGKTPEAVLSTCNMARTGEHEYIPESDFVAAELPSGAFLIFANDVCFFLENIAYLERLSQNAELFLCAVEEHAMISTASGWSNGIKSWEVTHDSNNGILDLQVSGNPPAIFSTIRDELITKQTSSNNCDCVFDIPIQLTKFFTGFRHDEDIEGASPEPFEVLVKVKQIEEKKRGFFSRMFS